MARDSTYVGETPPVDPPAKPAQQGPRPPGAQSNAAVPPRRPVGSSAPSMAPVPRGSASQAVPPRSSAPPARSQAPKLAPARQAKKFFPNQPRTVGETGLSQTMVEELVLKALFFSGEMRGSEISQKIKLPQVIIDDIIEGLRKSKYVDLKGGAGMGVGKSGMVYTLTTFATDLMRQILDRNRYNGPAPVRMEDWFESVSAQTVRGMRINRDRMEASFSNLVVKDYIFDGLGPAMNSGKAVFFYGPPGNGKTALCQALVQCYDGDIWVPHALLVDDFIIRVYDPTLHQPAPDDPNVPVADSRWMRIKRPLVVVGGELTLETLDLVYSPDVKFYEAPFQLKATNGMLLIDDFGRQRVSPKDLLNRWIVPLESEVDYLTMHTGKKLKVPFDVFVAFSTNLDPKDLVDDAFLRRVRYKLAVQPPDKEQFHQIWRAVCQKKNVQYNAGAIDWLIENHYQPTEKPFAACQPRDLLDQIIDIAHYRNEQPQLTEELMDSAAKNYFVRFD